MSPVWNAERLARLRELVAEGLTSAAIGKRLGFTRNAVCGARKRHAIGLGEAAPEPRRGPRPERHPAPANRSVALRREAPQLAAHRPERVREPHPVAKDGVPLLHLEYWMCRWPLPQSDASEIHFCGKPSVDGRPYCEEHGQQSRRSAA
jgi:GcrA cell cycle regulator